MKWPKWRWPWNGHDAKAARERAEEQLQAARRQVGQVRREASKPLPSEEFVDRVSRAFRMRPS